MIVVVAGALAGRPGNGGGAWVRLSWIRGLQRLGCDVYVLEQLDEGWRDVRGQKCRPEESANLAFFREIVRDHHLDDRASLFSTWDGRIYGPNLVDLEDLAASADLLVNISGNLRLGALRSRFRRRVFVDLDPGYTQDWHLRGLVDLGLDDHHRHFTVATRLGQEDCPIPTCGYRWIPIVPPVVLDDWPTDPPSSSSSFTTVARWRGPWGPPDASGRPYPGKHHEFRRLIDLPALTDVGLELALEIDAADASDRDALVSRGWSVVDATSCTRTPDDFRAYVQSSLGELSPAQGVYTQTRSGWFSDRTTRYLASGRPAIVQETGFGSAVPTGEGLLTFRTIDEAAAAIGIVAGNYAAHAHAARQLAEGVFASGRVLTEFLDQAGH